jgi:hypothetical protein
MKRAAFLLALVACKGGDPPQLRAPSEVPVSASDPLPVPLPLPVPDPTPSLLPTPRIDLSSDLSRFHVHDRGLLVPIATESLRKYDLEYRSAWGAVRDTDGHHGRALRAARATLTILSDGPAQILVRARGKGSLSLSAGRTKLGRAKLDGTWQELTFDAPALPAGNLALTLEAPKGTLVHSIELAAPAAPG